MSAFCTGSRTNGKSEHILTKYGITSPPYTHCERSAPHQILAI